MMKNTMYEVKCDECKRTIRRTDNIRESYAGGRCDMCATRNRYPSFDRNGNPIMVSIPGRTE